MTYRGHIENGVVVLDEPAALPDGCVVSVELALPSGDSLQSLREGLLKVAGTIKDLPEDMSENHDYYIHGTPRQ